ncbi:MAG: DUF1292 domain-containing protein [Bacilli bacterium]|nr:DUF1292 domain-containing protein [Bacilli bacterium]
MEEKKDMFKVMLETGEVTDAELLNVVEISGTEYAIYSIDNGDGTVKIMSSKLIIDENGNDALADMDNPEHKELISEYVKQLAS